MQTNAPAGTVLARNCLRLEAKFDGLIIMKALLFKAIHRLGKKLSKVC
jgi:hypothetical protein